VTADGWLAIALASAAATGKPAAPGIAPATPTRSADLPQRILRR
jgi:hypothetical protein